MGIPQNEWLELLKKEYLTDFIPNGGSAVRIAVVPPCDTQSIIGCIDQEASSCNFLVARVDSAATRADKVEAIFHEVARQVDWDELAERWLRSSLPAAGLIVPPDTSLSDIELIAEQNYRDKATIQLEMNRIIGTAIFRNHRLSKPFRVAITALCVGQTNPQNVTPSHSELVKQWFKGEKCSLTDLKKLQIFQRVARHNARQLLNSLACWVKIAGYSGLAVVLDLNAVLTKIKPFEGPVRYSTGNVKDCYEVLRQFKDDTDKSSNLLLVVVAKPELLHDNKRGLDIYDALKQRTYNDVRVKDHSNPLNVLVTLEEGERRGSCYA